MVTATAAEAIIIIYWSIVVCVAYRRHYGLDGLGYESP